MVDASESGIVDGASLDVRRLLGTVVGSILITWWAMGIRTAEAVMSWGRKLLLSPLDAASALFREILMIPANSFESANQAAAEFMMMLQPIGPLVWPLAMIATILTIIAAQEVVSRIEVI